MQTNWSLPTILIAGSALRHRETFVVGLQHQGFLVLESHSETEALEIARLHSRPIHVMLIDEDTFGRSLAEKLKLYRHDMHVLFINWSATENHGDELAPHLALSKIREILKPEAQEFQRHAGAA